MRTRFAPSPTGLQHLGGIRTALFNWLWAQKNKGQFSLRFEDTDQSRQVREAEGHITETLQWLSIVPDEGPENGPHKPYKQSQRLDIYKKYADQLLAAGRMYRDWTPTEELEAMRKQAQTKKRPFRVRANMLNTDGDEKQPHVLRFKIDTGGKTSWPDVIRGKQGVVSDEIDDFIAIKSDGFPTYNFANVIDDHEMEITHVLRGDEFLASTPKHLQVYAALDWEPPQFAHLPPVLGKDKAKLSKRHGAEDALVYRDRGYLPEAIINFLASLGWNDGTEQEIFSRDELIEQFDLSHIQKSPAVFDPKRLEWMNGMHIRRLNLDDLYSRSQDFWPKEADRYDDNYKKQVLSLVQERLKYLAELGELTAFFFTAPQPPQLKDSERSMVAAALDTLKDSDFTESDLEQRLRVLADGLNVSTGELFGALRLVSTGQKVAPGLFETMSVLGKDETLSRLKAAV